MGVVTGSTIRVGIIDQAAWRNGVS